MASTTSIDANRSNVATRAERQRRGRRKPMNGNADYLALACRLQALGFGADGKRRTIGVTSSLRGEGVSTVAQLLAQQAANCDSTRVLIVDCNISNPIQHKLLRTNQSPGLSTFMAGEAKPHDCIANTQNENLWVMPAGTNKSFSGSNFRPQEVLKFLNDVEEHFDQVVVDLPAISEPTNISQLVAGLDGVLFVLEAERTTANRATRSLKQLKQNGADVLGIVFNRSRRYFSDWLLGHDY